MLEHGLGEDLLLALEGVVKRFGDGEEIAVAFDDLPLGLDPHVVHEGNEAAQDLGDSAAHPRGIDVDEVAASHALREMEEEIHRAARREVPIGFDAWTGHVHRRAPRSTPSSWA